MNLAKITEHMIKFKRSKEEGIKDQVKVVKNTLKHLELLKYQYIEKDFKSGNNSI